MILIWILSRIHQWKCLVLDFFFFNYYYWFNLLTNNQSIQVFYFFIIKSWKILFPRNYEFFLLFNLLAYFSSQWSLRICCIYVVSIAMSPLSFLIYLNQLSPLSFSSLVNLASLYQFCLSFQRTIKMFLWAMSVIV